MDNQVISLVFKAVYYNTFKLIYLQKLSCVGLELKYKNFND